MNWMRVSISCGTFGSTSLIMAGDPNSVNGIGGFSFKGLPKVSACEKAHRPPFPAGVLPMQTFRCPVIRVGDYWWLTRMNETIDYVHLWPSR